MMKNRIRLTHVIATISLLCIVGCSSSSGTKAACTAEFAGNSAASVDLPANCAVISPATDSSDAGAAGAAPDSGVGTATGYTLNLVAGSKEISQLKVSIDLGAAPAAGTFSSENVTSWSASGLSSDGSNCEYSAGSEYVPVGNFTLTLTSVDSSNGGAGQAHGTLDLTTYVHAPPATNCGIGDTEEIFFSF